MTLVELQDFLEANYVWTIFGLVSSFFIFPSAWIIWMILWRKHGAPHA